MSKKLITIAAVAVVGSAGVGVLAATAVGTSGKPAPTSALLAATPTKAPAALEYALKTDLLAEFDVATDSARSLHVDGETWTIAASAASLCAQFPGQAVSCTERRSLNGSDLAITTIEKPDPGEKTLTARPAVRRGIVADDVARVRASDNSGRVIDEFAVSNNGYRVSLGVEGQAASLAYLSADGSVIRKIDPFG